MKKNSLNYKIGLYWRTFKWVMLSEFEKEEKDYLMDVTPKAEKNDEW